MVDVFVNGHPGAARKKMLARLPNAAGIYLVLVRPPHTRSWVAVYLGACNNLRAELDKYLHTDGR